MINFLLTLAVLAAGWNGDTLTIYNPTKAALYLNTNGRTVYLPDSLGASTYTLSLSGPDRDQAYAPKPWARIEIHDDQGQVKYAMMVPPRYRLYFPLALPSASPDPQPTASNQEATRQ